MAQTGRGLRDLVVDLAPKADEATLGLLLCSLAYRAEQAGTHAFEAVIAETGGPASAPAAFTGQGRLAALPSGRRARYRSPGRNRSRPPC